MFGKGGGPLNAWIKEFCELVFIQTLQAFIFAIIISFVVNLSATNIVDDDDRNAAYGIICIVALTSIFKVEDIARRIFGYGPTKADHGNAVQSIGKSMMALRMGKNLLDNGKKIIGGAGAVIGARSQKIKAYKRANARKDALEKDNGADEANSSSRINNASANNPGVAGSESEKQKLLAQAQEKRNESINKRREAQEIRKSSPSKMSKRDREEAARKLENEALNIDLNARNLEEKANAMEEDYSNTNTTKSRSGNVKDYNQKKLQIEEELNDKISEINKKKRLGIKQMVSGVAETGAAMVGFTAGTAMSVASTNDWGGAMKDGVTWAGTADAVTAGAIDMGFAAEEFLGNRARNLNKMRKEYQGYVTEAKKQYVNDFIAQANAQAEEYSEATESDRKAAEKDVTETIKKIESEVSNSTNKPKSVREVAHEKFRMNHSLKAQKSAYEGKATNNSVSTRKINEAYKQVRTAEKKGKTIDIDKNVFN